MNQSYWNDLMQERDKNFRRRLANECREVRIWLDYALQHEKQGALNEAEECLRIALVWEDKSKHTIRQIKNYARRTEK